MPKTAEMVDELRAILGREWVDRAIAASQRARREHAHIAAEHGQAQADAWLARQKFSHGRFYAEEAGRTVGIKARGTTCN